jgi:hypothetical protein
MDTRTKDRIDRHGISKGDILFLNQRGYFERVSFAISITPQRLRRRLHQLSFSNALC